MSSSKPQEERWTPKKILCGLCKRGGHLRLDCPSWKKTIVEKEQEILQDRTAFVELCQEMLIGPGTLIEAFETSYLTGEGETREIFLITGLESNDNIDSYITCMVQWGVARQNIQNKIGEFPKGTREQRIKDGIFPGGAAALVFAVDKPLKGFGSFRSGWRVLGGIPGCYFNMEDIERAKTIRSAVDSFISSFGDFL